MSRSLFLSCLLMVYCFVLRAEFPEASKIQPPKQQALIDANCQDYMIINEDFKPKMEGMFSNLTMVLGHLYLYEMDAYNIVGMEVDFKEEGLYYDEAHGPNWWSYYFEPLKIGSKTGAKKVREFTFNECRVARKVRMNALSHERGASIVKKYFRVKPHIKEKVDKFIAENFSKFTIGVHYRGTDHSTVSPRVGYEKVMNQVKKEVSKLGAKSFSIFVASDEKAFLDNMREAFPGKVICTECYRSEDRSAVHLSDQNPYQLGEEAILDSLTLSRCNLLIRTPSQLSQWSTYFNGNLRCIVIF